MHLIILTEKLYLIALKHWLNILDNQATAVDEFYNYCALKKLNDLDWWTATCNQ